MIRTALRVDELFADVVSTFEGRLELAGIGMRTEKSGLVLHADHSLVKRTIENLVDNAIRHSPPRCEITISAKEGDGQVSISVADQGPGVPPDMFDKIFDLYVQGTSSDATTRGLGLAFCKLAMEAHGGRVWVERNGERGSRFCLRLAAGPMA